MDYLPSELDQSELRFWVHNRVADAQFGLSLTGLRVFAFAVTCLRIRAFDLSAYFTVGEYSALIGSSSHSVSGDLRAAAKELLETEIRLPTDDYRQKEARWRSWETMKMVTGAKLDQDSGVFEFTFSHELAPYVSNVRKSYCTFDLRQAMRLTSRHAFRWLALVASWRGKLDKHKKQQPFIVRMDDLRAMLGLGESEYEKHSHFRTRLLDDPIAQLRAHTDVHFAYRAKRAARKAIYWEIWPRMGQPTTRPNDTVANDETAPFSDEEPPESSDAAGPFPFRALKQIVRGGPMQIPQTPADAPAEEAGKMEQIKRQEMKVEDCRKTLELTKQLEPCPLELVALRAEALRQAEAELAALRASAADP